MELIEPVWFTLTALHDLIKSNKDIGGEVEGLQETVQLVEMAMKPLLEQDENIDCQELLNTVNITLEGAKNALQRIENSRKNKKGFFSLQFFRGSKDIEELKSYQEKLKSLTPILSLAISTHVKKQQNKEENNNNNNNVNMNNNENSLASKVLKFEDAKKFWTEHFGEAFSIPWQRFKAAFTHEYVHGKQYYNNKNELIPDDISVRLLKDKLDPERCGEVNIYELAKYTKDADLIGSFANMIKTAAPVSPNSSKKRKLDEVDSESVPTQLDELSEQPPAKKGKLMPPPLSPSTKKPRSPQRSLFPPSTPSIALIEPNSDHAKILSSGGVSEIDADYQLSLIGDSDIITRKECANILTVNRKKEEPPLVLGRMFFEKLPKEFLVRISRAHCELSSATDEQGQTRYFVTDRSGNGTYVNGKLVGRDNKVEILHNQNITILKSPDIDLHHIQLGYTFKNMKVGRNVAKKFNFDANLSENSNVDPKTSKLFRSASTPDFSNASKQVGNLKSTINAISAFKKGLKSSPEDPREIASDPLNSTIESSFDTQSSSANSNNASE
jgi:pSer/pThr/pTyr-binding forkhead associated (FHA) protein